MKRIVVAILALMTVMSLFLLVRAAAVGAGGPATVPAQRLELPGSARAMRFVPVDIFLDTGAKPLGAYQVEIVAGNASIVGIEGGDPAPFKDAPFYDPAALRGGNRIIVAAFSTDEHLPTGANRVARLHLAMSGGAGETPDLTSKLVVATDGSGQTIPTTLTVRVSGTLQGEPK